MNHCYLAVMLGLARGLGFRLQRQAVHHTRLFAEVPPKEAPFAEVPKFDIGKEVPFAATAPDLQTEGDAVTIIIAANLRSALKLPGKLRRTRCFVADGADDGQVRAAVEEKIPALKLATYELARDFPGSTRITVEGTVEVQEEDAAAEAPAPAGAYRMLSYYHFFAEARGDVEGAVAAFRRNFESLGVLGRAYVAAEGVNAQLAVPEDRVEAFRAVHEGLFSRLGEAAPGLNLDGVADGRLPFRKLQVVAREQVVADGGGVELDLSDPGADLEPEAWHAELGGDFGGAGPDVTLLDVRNHYETAVGTFAGATPLGTETFKDTYQKLDDVLASKDRSEPVYMFCTGGIRCVKAGAYVKQKLGFSDVRRLRGGVVNYTRALETPENSRFRGVNYVFNDRVGEVVTEPERVEGAPLDPRAAEALILAGGLGGDEDPVEAYATQLSAREPEVCEAARLDALARFPTAGHMCSGPTQGRLLYTLCRLMRAKRVLELGTFCGYGSLWLAAGAAERVVTVDRDERTSKLARSHFQRAPAGWAPIDVVIKDRGLWLREDAAAAGPFDFVYVDCDKKGYAAVYDALMDGGLLTAGAALVFDNTLWKGRVVDGAVGMTPAEEEAVVEAATREAAGADVDDVDAFVKRALKDARRDRAICQSLHEFNVKLRKDPRVEQLLLPLRDGLTVVTAAGPGLTL